MYKYSRRELILQMIANGMLAGLAIGELILFIFLIKRGYTMLITESPLVTWIELITFGLILCIAIWLIVSAFKRLRITPSVRNLTTRKRIKVK